MSQSEHGYLDGLTNAKTAFATWAEFCSAMNTGYVPTIYPGDRRSKQLRKAVVNAGYNVWPKYQGE